MKKNLALFLALALIFSCTAAMADSDVYLFSSHDFLDSLINSDIFSIETLKDSSLVRALLVFSVLRDYMDNGIVDSLPEAFISDTTCVSINDDDGTFSVLMPLEDQLLVSFSSISGDLAHGYYFSDCDINDRLSMRVFMNTLIEQKTYNDYWFVPLDDILEITALINN